MNLTEKLNLMQVLPGLYMARDLLLEQIQTVETSLGLTEKRRGRPPIEREQVTPTAIAKAKAEAEQPAKSDGRKTAPHHVVGSPEYLAWKKKNVAAHRRYWKGMTPEQKQARVDAMKAGRLAKAKAVKRNAA